MGIETPTLAQLRQPELDPKGTDPKEYAEAWYQHYRARWIHSWEGLHAATDIDSADEPNSTWVSDPERLERSLLVITMNERLAELARTAMDSGWTVAVMSAARGMFSGSGISSSALANAVTREKNEACREFLKAHRHFVEPHARRILETM
jgi:hypothetical protein